MKMEATLLATYILKIPQPLLFRPSATILLDFPQPRILTATALPNLLKVFRTKSERLVLVLWILSRQMPGLRLHLHGTLLLMSEQKSPLTLLRQPALFLTPSLQPRAPPTCRGVIVSLMLCTARVLRKRTSKRSRSEE